MNRISMLVIHKLRPHYDKERMFLYELLKERDEFVNISHQELPTYKEHINYIITNSHKVWNIIYNNKGIMVGQLYLTKNNEVGIQIAKAHQRKGYASAALNYMISQFSDIKLLANVNPNNQASINLFKKFGFVHIQNTYVLSSPRIIFEEVF